MGALAKEKGRKIGKDKIKLFSFMPANMRMA